ncbi:MAG: metal-dependent hydrolase [Methanotrichaceae archaeon]|nr:metal-dependent hydrolase [Methanotrichaceae archaeon]
MRITWHGHSCFELIESLNILVDPYIERNPVAKCSVGDFNPDLIAVTHAHADHLGNAGDIARRTGCLVISNPEVARHLDKTGARAEGMNIGGSYSVSDVQFHMTPALHSSGMNEIDPGIYGGEAVGFVIDDIIRIYHAGDTGLFSDMHLIGELLRPQVAMLPIGGRFTMGPREAAIATSWIRPEIAIPMHYNTYKAIEQDPAEYQELVETLCDTEVLVLDVGESIEY